MKKIFLTLSFIFGLSIINFSQISCPDTVCVGDNVTYSVINTPGSTYNWELLPLGPLIPTVNFQNITWNFLPGTYTLNVTETNQFNCVGQTQTCVIEVVDVSTTLEQIGPFCEGDESVNLVATPLGGVFSGQFINNNTFNPSTAGLYTITYTFTNQFGCVSQSTIIVIVNPLPNTTPIIHD